MERRLRRRQGDGRQVKTRWSLAGGKRTGWLEVDLQKEAAVARADVYEFEQRIASWALEIKDGESWKVVASGNGIGTKKTISFPPVKARYVRLNILESNDSVPSLYEFHLFQE